MACPPLICRTFGNLELLWTLKATVMLFARMNNDFPAPVWPLALIADSPIAMTFASIPDLLFMVNKLSSAATKLNRSSIRTAIAVRTSEIDLDVWNVQFILHEWKARAKSIYKGNWWWKIDCCWFSIVVCHESQTQSLPQFLFLCLIFDCLCKSLGSQHASPPNICGIHAELILFCQRPRANSFVPTAQNYVRLPQDSNLRRNFPEDSMIFSSPPP